MEVLARKGQGHIFDSIDYYFTGPGFLFFQTCFLSVVTLRAVVSPADAKLRTGRLLWYFFFFFFFWKTCSLRSNKY